MRSLISKILLFVICSFFVSQNELSPSSIACLVIALGISSLCTAIEGSKYLIPVAIVYLITCIPLVTASSFIPLIIYDCYKKKYDYIVYITTAIVSFHYFVHIPTFYFMLYLGIIGVSLILADYNINSKNLIKTLHKTTDDGKELAEKLKKQNSTVIDNQNYKIHTATLSERNRIAREIHDNVGHMLTRSILQLGAIKAINTNDTLTKPLEDLSTTLDTAMTNIRSSVHDLYDESIDLKSALEDIIKDVTTLNLLLDYDMPDGIPRTVKYGLIAISKEAVNNIIKHSNGSRGKIVLRDHPAFYHMEITDNGTSAKPADLNGSKSGIGLNNMKQRVESMNGTIRFSTDNGFSIYITIMKKQS